MEATPIKSIAGPSHGEIEMLDGEIVTLEEETLVWSGSNCDKSEVEGNSEKHKESHSETNHEESLTCEKCDFTCSTTNTLTNHMKTHSIIECTVCSFTTLSPENLA